MPKKYRQEPDVQLIPYFEYDPSIHNVEYRYIPNQSPEGFRDVTYNYAHNNANDWWRQPYPYPFPPRPFYGPYGFHGPYGGMPYGGWGGGPWGGYHPGYHPWGGWGGWHHESSPSR